MFHLPKEAGNTRRFDPVGGFGVLMPYTVPIGAVALLIIAIGGGGAGGGGFTRVAGNAGGGGGGGGSGCMSRIFVPTEFLPDTLYVSPGQGGAPSAGNGVASTVQLLGSSIQIPAQICHANGGVGGGNATGAAAGPAGAAGAISTAGPFSALGNYVSIGGSAGTIGGAPAGAIGTALGTSSSTVPLTGGAGGAGCTTTNFNGGNINGNAFWPTLDGGGVGIEGAAGLESWMPLIFSGGAGGGSNNSGVGGRGGNGGRGCGGGGGGAGATGGAGGRGGDGLILITAIY